MATQSTYVHQPRHKHEGERTTFSLPLSDSDRSYLKMHAVRQGKSPNAPDDVLLSIWNGVDPAPVRAELDWATIDGIRKDAIAAAVAAVEQHRPVRIEIKQGAQIRTLPDGHRHPVFGDVLAALSVRENVYLVGPAGSGKTTIAAQAADALGLPFYSTGAVGMAYQLQGFINAEGKYMETDLYRAYVGGGVFLFDEIDASSAQALLAFNAIAANDLAAFPCGTVKRHADFVIIAAANTWGSGADAQYVGRAQLDAATLDRFAFISMDYDERLELAISSNDEWTRYVQAFRRITRQLKIRAVVSPRASIKGGKLLSAGLSWNRVEEMLLIRGLSANEVEQVRAQLPQRKVA
jgi:MoxR-like ATPase